jgi:hypothetical protein
MLLIAGDISPTALMVAGTQTVKGKNRINDEIGAPARGPPLKNLAPTAFNPDVSAASVAPAARNPAGAGMGRGDIIARNPHITLAVPTVVTAAPYPVAMGAGTDGNDFTPRRRRADADGDLGLGEACGEQKAAHSREEEFLHLVRSPS